MSTTIDKVQNIQNQVHRLVDLYRRTKNELDEKANELARLTDLIKNEQKKNSDLNSQIEQLRLIIAFDGNQKDRSAMKGQLNEWIKEINKCLAQLNV
jgi:uncharacterized protein YlxW (UPF0749 family)|tara:strand:- start:1527 stop:1817 length:291 start_codon:yes stop_codon:yes gene_type:complete